MAKAIYLEFGKCLDKGHFQIPLFFLSLGTALILSEDDGMKHHFRLPYRRVRPMSTIVSVIHTVNSPVAGI